MTNIIKARREAGAICKICHSPDYKILPPYPDTTRPRIQCNSCGHYWTCGRDGGIYKELEKRNV